MILATTPWESQTLLHILQLIEKKKTYVEIGGAEGDSLRTIGPIIDKGGLLISVDIGRKKIFQLEKTVQDLQKTHSAHLVLGDSKSPKTVNTVKQLLHKREIDILLIDGDHSIWGVVNDIQNYTSLVRHNGIIIFHDCGRLNGAQFGQVHMAEVGSIFRAFAWKKPYILLQEFTGLGIVWNREMEVIDKYKEIERNRKWH